MIVKTEIYKNVDKVFSGPEGSLNTLLSVLTQIKEARWDILTKLLQQLSKKQAME